jgi:hypothetical protein
LVQKVNFNPFVNSVFIFDTLLKDNTSAGFNMGLKIAAPQASNIFSVMSIIRADCKQSFWKVRFIYGVVPAHQNFQL